VYTDEQRAHDQNEADERRPLSPIEEARDRNGWEGFHPFHSRPDPYLGPMHHGQFEIFFHAPGLGMAYDQISDEGRDEPEEEYEQGWYWWACFPGCLPDGEPSGPFDSSREALKDADEWNPEFEE